MNSIAYCYLAIDKAGDSDAHMRRLSIASLRRHCGDVPVFTYTVKRRHNAHGDDVLDLSDEWEWAFGKTDPFELAPKPRMGGKRWDNAVFCKFLLPFSPELSMFDRIVHIDSDIEVLSPRFGEAPKLSDDADIGLVESFDNPMISPKMASFVRKGGRACGRYTAASYVLHRSQWTSGYLDRLRFGYEIHRKFGFDYPEEMTANMYLIVQHVDERFAMVPSTFSQPGRSKEEMGNAFAAHYRGTRKNVYISEWEKRYGLGGCP